MLAITSLVLSIVSLVVYVSVIEGASATVFVVSTVGAFVAGVVSLVLALVARKQIGQQGAKSKGRLLVTMSIVVAVGYLVCVSIVMLNIVVQWVI
ncbi:MAG: hypothetical protein SXV54_10560 [Chloroflexota bacterium]|nr:hypothetical protein [Chloroflexota bacterium]